MFVFDVGRDRFGRYTTNNYEKFYEHFLKN